MGWKDAPVVGDEPAWASAPIVGEKPKKKVSEPEFYNPTPAEAAAADPLMRFALGAGKGVAGAVQAASRIPAVEGTLPFLKPASDWLMRQFERTEQIGRPNYEGWNVAGVAGEIANPIGLGLTKIAPAAKSVADRIGQGAVFGGAYGATQPVASDKTGDFASEKAQQIGTGVVLGGLIPGGIEASKFIGRTVGDIYEVAMARMSEPARRRLAEKLANENMTQIVGADNLQKVVAEVERRVKEAPKIAGYKPTVGELVSDVPEASPLLALQQGTGKTSGGISAQFGTRVKEQNEAIRNAIRAIGGTPDELRAAEKVAKDAAKENYGPTMGRQFSLASDTQMFGDEIARARGVPLNVPPSARNAVVPVPPNQTVTGVQIPYGQVPPYSGRIGALQQAGQLQTEAAQQANFANNWLPVPGMPRAPARYSLNAERVPEAQAGARAAADQVSRHDATISFLETAMTNLRNKGALAEDSAVPLMQRPSMQNAVEYARRLAAERGYKFPQSLDDQFSGQNLHDIKLGLDAQIRAGANKNAPTALDDTTLSAIGSTKDQFIKWFEQKAPDYGKARVNFAKDMQRPNQMTVAQALEDKLLNPQGQMTPGSFMRAISDETRTVKNALGQPRQDFSAIFNPRQQETIQSVGGLLESRVRAQNPLQSTVIGGQNIAEQGILSLPNMLYRPTMVANWMLGRLKDKGGPIEQAIDEINAFRLLNPEEFVKAVNAMPKQDASRVMKMLSAGKNAGASVMNQGLLAPAIQAVEDVRQ